VQDTQIIALIAYLQRLGTDISLPDAPPPAASPTDPSAPEVAVVGENEGGAQ
jgi:hypothetical protein